MEPVLVTTCFKGPPVFLTAVIKDHLYTITETAFLAHTWLLNTSFTVAFYPEMHACHVYYIQWNLSIQIGFKVNLYNKVYTVKPVLVTTCL